MSGSWTDTNGGFRSWAQGVAPWVVGSSWRGLNEVVLFGVLWCVIFPILFCVYCVLRLSRHWAGWLLLAVAMAVASIIGAHQPNLPPTPSPILLSYLDYD